MGGSLNALISEKITLVPGDVTCENLGVKDSNLVEEMWREVDIVVNLAATTNFDERYVRTCNYTNFSLYNIKSASRQFFQELHAQRAAGIFPAVSEVEFWLERG